MESPTDQPPRPDDGPRVVALRGATTLDADTRDQVLERTTEMLGALLARNGLRSGDLISLIFTATDDIHSEFPAAAVREAGISDVPMLCARELAIAGPSNIPLCIRVMAHVHTDRAGAALRHPYLHGARQLRSDLPE
ncbi:chorismate mutase [soil metagenome]